MRPSRKQVLICLVIAVVLTFVSGAQPPSDLGGSILPFVLGKILGFFILCMIPTMIANAIANRKGKQKTDKA